jgi:hypothetical protein
MKKSERKSKGSSPAVPPQTEKPPAKPLEGDALKAFTEKLQEAMIANLGRDKKPTTT